MHQLLGPHNLAAKGRADRLVAQANTQNRQFARKVLNRRHRNARLGR